MAGDTRKCLSVQEAGLTVMTLKLSLRLPYCSISSRKKNADRTE